MSSTTICPVARAKPPKNSRWCGWRTRGTSTIARARSSCTCCRSSWAKARVNAALRRFVAAHRFQGPPYLRSLDLISELRKEARTSAEQQLITDLFEAITLYDLKVSDAVTRKVGDRWQTNLTVIAGKFTAYGKGQERAVAFAEPIEIGLFTARPGLGAFSSKNVLLMERRPIQSGTSRIVLTSRVKPTFAGIDPYNFRIDRISDDNVKDVTNPD